MKHVRRLWQGWKRFGKKVGDFQARLLLSAFYFVGVAPFGLAMRAADPLGLRHAGAGWRVRPPIPEEDFVIRARRQS